MIYVSVTGVEEQNTEIQSSHAVSVVYCTHNVAWSYSEGPAKRKAKGSQGKQALNSFLRILIVNSGKVFCLFLLHLLAVWRAAMATTLNQYTYQRLMQNMPQFAYDHNLCGLTSKAQKHTNWINHQPRHTAQPATSIQGIYLRSCCS